MLFFFPFAYLLISEPAPPIFIANYIDLLEVLLSGHIESVLTSV